MNLTEEQRKTVAGWITQGLKLSEIQSRLASDLGLRLTYMEARLLVDDLKLVPKDPEPRTILNAGPAPARPGTAAAPSGRQPAPAPGAAPAKPKGVSMTVDQVARPGAVVSGEVTFSDGNTATWHFDQYGTPGLMPKQPGYRPSQTDLQQFQKLLQEELVRMGFY